MLNLNKITQYRMCVYCTGAFSFDIPLEGVRKDSVIIQCPICQLHNVYSNGVVFDDEDEIEVYDEQKPNN